MSKIDNTLIIKVIADIKNNPEKLDSYLQILVKTGVLKGIKEIKLSQCSSGLLAELHANGTKVILK